MDTILVKFQIILYTCNSLKAKSADLAIKRTRDFKQQNAELLQKQQLSFYINQNV
jgi:hypothetical protein